MALPSFEFRLNESIRPGLVVIGKFFGNTPSLACATSDDNVLITSPHTVGEDSKMDERRLNVTHKISAISAAPVIGASSSSSSSRAAGSVDEKDGGEDDGVRDALLIGTGTHLQAYDVRKNEDLFFNSISVRPCSSSLHIPLHKQPLLLPLMTTLVCTSEKRHRAITIPSSLLLLTLSLLS